MPDAEVTGSGDMSAELRMLRAKAYGPGGRLTAAELSRLQELEGRSADAGERLRLASLAQPVEAFDNVVPDPSTGSGADVGSNSIAEPVEAFESDVPDPLISSRTGTRRSWPYIAAASAALLAVGLGAGWGIWGQQVSSIPLTDEQRSWQEELLAADEYDPGSVIAVKEHEGVVAWVATKDVGEESCLLLSNGTDSSASCRFTEQVNQEGLWGELSIADPTDADIVTLTHAMALFDADGRPAVRMNQYQNYTDGAASFDPEVEPIADRLIEHGYSEESLWIVGYFEGSPIWQANPSDGRTESCLVYTATVDATHEICADADALEDGLTLNILDDEGAKPRGIEMTLAFPQNGPHYLTVTVRPATGVVVDSETGDTIEFTTDEPMFDDFFGDDPAIDDKTGGVGE